MVENVNMYKIEIDNEYGAFLGSTKLFWFQIKILLTHFVKISQKEGKWVTELSLREFVTNFPINKYFIGKKDFCDWVLETEKEGYLTIETRDGPGNDVLRVTKKFAELCEEECA